MISHYFVLISFTLFVPSCSEFESRDGCFCLEVQGRPVKGQGRRPIEVRVFDVVAVLLKLYIPSLGACRELTSW